MNNIIFFENTSLDALDDNKYHHYTDLLVYVRDENADKIIDAILESNPRLNNLNKLFTNGDTIAYHLY